MTSGLWNSINSFATIIDCVSDQLDSTWKDKQESEASSEHTKRKYKQEVAKKAYTPQGDKFSYHNETITTRTSKGALPAPLSDIPRLVKKTAGSSNDHLLRREDFVANLYRQLEPVVRSSQYYFIIISIDFLAKCSYEFEGAIYDDRVAWQVGSTRRQYYRVIVFSKGNIQLAAANDSSKLYALYNGIRSGLNLSCVNWLDKSIKQSNTYGTGNCGWLFSIDRLDRQIARIDIFYSTYIHGIRMLFADGTVKLLGIEAGTLYSYNFKYGEYIVGAAVTATTKINNIQFRTNYDEVTAKLGYDWQGDQYDISFNGRLECLSAVVYQGIENIKFHWK